MVYTLVLEKKNIDKYNVTETIEMKQLGFVTNESHLLLMGFVPPKHLLASYRDSTNNNNNNDYDLITEKHERRLQDIVGEDSNGDKGESFVLPLAYFVASDDNSVLQLANRFVFHLSLFVSMSYSWTLVYFCYFKVLDSLQMRLV